MSFIIYLFQLAAAIILFTTCWPRLNALDILHNRSKRNLARAAGLIVTAVGSVLTMFAAPGAFTTVIVGVAICWVTTPNQPPWWKYISKGDNGIEPLKRRVDDA